MLDRPPHPPAAPGPRTQRQRRAETRDRLVRAAIAVLVRRGYAGTTTTQICAQAGLSQGALFKHFPTKNDLLCAAAERLFADRVHAYRRAFDALDRRDPIDAAFDLLWSSIDTDELRGAFDLYLAARVEPELRARLAPVVAEHRLNLIEHAREIFPDAARRHANFPALVSLLVDAMQGAVIGEAGAPDPALPEVLTELRRLTHRFLGDLDAAEDA